MCGVYVHDDEDGFRLENSREVPLRLYDRSAFLGEFSHFQFLLLISQNMLDNDEIFTKKT